MKNWKNWVMVLLGVLVVVMAMLFIDAQYLRHSKWEEDYQDLETQYKIKNREYETMRAGVLRLGHAKGLLEGKINEAEQKAKSAEERASNLKESSGKLRNEKKELEAKVNELQAQIDELTKGKENAGDEEQTPDVPEEEPEKAEESGEAPEASEEADAAAETAGAVWGSFKDTIRNAVEGSAEKVDEAAAVEGN